MPSTVIRYLNYSAARRELRVTFTSGRRYAYEDVPPAVYAAFGGAASRGAFFNRHIRDHYAYRELTGSGSDRHRRIGSRRG